MSPTRLAALKAKSVGTLAKDVLRPDESIDAVWQHLVRGLEALAANGDPAQVKLNENGLTQRLITRLEEPPDYRPFFFQKEDMEDDTDGRTSKRVDVAVKARGDRRIVIDGLRFASGQRFLVLEAKRLPTPDREREYLAGDRGGVERFKLGHHAKELTAVGVIGYIQRHSFNYWRQTINTWVDELIEVSTANPHWDEDDKLQMEAESPRLAQLRSKNLRASDNQRLTMRHLWVQLANQTAGLSPEDMMRQKG